MEQVSKTSLAQAVKCIQLFKAFIRLCYVSAKATTSK